MNIQKKLGSFRTGFTFPLTYPELAKKKQSTLSKKGWVLYNALLTKAMSEESPAITLSIPEAKRAGLSAPTLRKCREELEAQQLISVTREGSDKSYQYELLHPTNGGQLPRSEQRKKVSAALKESYPVRVYTPDESFRVFEFLLGDRLQGWETHDGFEPKGGDDSRRFICPFHVPDFENPSFDSSDRKMIKAPLMVFADTGFWACAHKHCRHYFKKAPSSRAGDGYLVHFVRAFKWQMDASRYKTAFNLTSVQIREVIAQILDGVSCLADLKYTTQNVKTRELVRTPFDSDARQPVKPVPAPVPLIRRTVRPPVSLAAEIETEVAEF
jgi:hypothetical protein